MEMLSGNKGFGQSYGFVMYRTTVSKEAKQIGIRGLKDFGVVSSKDDALAAHAKAKLWLSQLCTLTLTHIHTHACAHTHAHTPQTDSCTHANTHALPSLLHQALIDGFSFKTLSWYDEQTFPISKPTEVKRHFVDLLLMHTTQLHQLH